MATGARETTWPGFPGSSPPGAAHGLVSSTQVAPAERTRVDAQESVVTALGHIGQCRSTIRPGISSESSRQGSAGGAPPTTRGGSPTRRVRRGPPLRTCWTGRAQSWWDRGGISVLRGRVVPTDGGKLRLDAPDPATESAGGLQFERLPDGETVLVSRAPLNAGSAFAPLGLQVLLSEPHRRVYQRADALAARILWVSLGLGVATALLGALGANRLTRRLKRLTLSVASIDRAGTARIEVPRGRDEAAQLGTAFARPDRRPRT